TSTADHVVVRFERDPCRKFGIEADAFDFVIKVALAPNDYDNSWAEGSKAVMAPECISVGAILKPVPVVCELANCLANCVAEPGAMPLQPDKIGRWTLQIADVAKVGC